MVILPDILQEVVKIIVEFFSYETIKTVLLHFVNVVLIITVWYMVLRAGRFLLEKLFIFRSSRPFLFSEKRIATLRGLTQSFFRYTLFFILVIALLNEFKVPAVSILAGAGVVGLAVGFGAQSLVKDVITGFFMIFENQIAVGDYVKIGNSEGTVIDVGLRTTRISAWTGEIHIIPNGNIGEIMNFSRSSQRSVVDIEVALEEDIEKVLKVTGEAIKGVVALREDIDELPEVVGITNINGTKMIIRITATTTSLGHWSLARELRLAVKKAYDREGIRWPFPTPSLNAPVQSESDIMYTMDK